MSPTSSPSKPVDRLTADRPDMKTELRALRKRLADAWWHEEPLEKIQQLEARINHFLALIRGQR